MTSQRDYFQKAITDELPAFVAVFRSLPQDKADFKPVGDDKARSAGQLASSMACSAIALSMVIETGKIDYTKLDWSQAQSFDAAATLIEQSLTKAKEVAAQASDDLWDSEAVMMSGEKEEWKEKRGDMVFSLFFDLIHHRGQISTYIRPMGGKVPTIYGPSGDSQS